MRNENFQNDPDKIRLINFRVFEANLEKLFRYLENFDVEPILIKGWAAAQYYPKPWSRKLGDVDLAFNPKDFEKAKKILDDYEFLPVDIHRGLRHLDSVDFEDLFQNSVKVDCCGMPIRVLRVEDHLRVLCVHWMNDGGIDKERLWDVFYAIESARENFDWNRCLEIISPRRKLWIQSLILLVNEYLGLDIEKLPIDKKLKRNSRWIMRTVEKEWRSGTRLIPLEHCVGDNKLFFQQVLKRIPPNPLQAIIELEKDMDVPVRIHYQLMNIFTRLNPSVQRILGIKR